MLIALAPRAVSATTVAASGYGLSTIGHERCALRDQRRGVTSPAAHHVIGQPELHRIKFAIECHVIASARQRRRWIGETRVSVEADQCRKLPMGPDWIRCSMKRDPRYQGAGGTGPVCSSS